ncbi:MAG: sensor domain-containing diguanylate cyclase [Candidatus Omnitrophota bacterium]
MLKKTRTLFPLKFAASAVLSLLLFFFLPIYFAKSQDRNSYLALCLFYLVNIFCALFLLKVYYAKKYSLEYKIQDLQERLNILKDELSGELQNNAGLKIKIARYDNLKDAIEKLNRNLNLDSVAENLTTIAFSHIGRHQGVCILYFIDKQLNLQIFKTKKEDKGLILRAKEGDPFDYWVLRHLKPLLIEDVGKDFRFDLEKLNLTENRPISSLISSPLMSEHRVLGTLRLDHVQERFFTQDDLRFLVTVCDLGAVALENSELFQKTRNLANHDTLTSLYTKGFFLERLKDECQRALRQNAELFLLMLDIDFFKNYNDRFGHTAGDIVLKKLAQVMGAVLKDANAVVSRFGGEEFSVLLPHTDKKEARRLAQNLRLRIEDERIILRRQETRVTVSIGICGFPSDAADEEGLIRKADKALYRAKQKGRNQICCI